MDNGGLTFKGLVMGAVVLAIDKIDLSAENTMVRLLILGV
jgi:hypothetical protein